MYSLKPFYDSNAPVKTPDCMYNYKIQSNETRQAVSCEKSSASSTSTGLSNQPTGDAWNLENVRNLENRQNDILKRLEALKAEVDKLASPTDTQPQKIIKVESKESQGLLDIVISAHPTSPPCALLVLQRMLAKQRRVLTACHRHSSARDVTERLLTVLASDDNQEVIADRNQYDIVFTLIWKDVPHGPQMMVDPRTQTSIHGEANIARYLARLLTPAYDAGDAVTSTVIDQWVDSAERFSRGNNKERAAVLKSMNSHLGKNEWMVGQSVSLADVMLWGAICRAKEDSKAPANVKKWYQRCSEQAEFSAVLERL